MIKCGFFNSINGDRTYQASEMTRPYELLVSNGVFATQQGTPSNYLQVYATNSMSVTVKAGRGIFFDKWFLSDADMTLTLDASEVTLPRVDSIIVKVDVSEAVRAATIYVKKGTPNSSATVSNMNTYAPAVERTDTVKEYRLANIYVAAGVVSIGQTSIQDTRGLSDCGWVTSLVQQLDYSTLYIQWQTAFDNWFNDVKETLATSTLIRSYNSRYITTTQDETTIPINISQYNKNLDILQVYINGLMLIKDVEYTILSNSQISLTNGVDTGTSIAFVVYKSIDGSDAETVVSQVNALQNLVNTSIVTSDTGSTKINVNSGEDPLVKFVAAGKGFHTMYIQSGALNMPSVGAYRAVGHLTGETAGWIMIFQASGSVYTNYMNESVWRGWKAIYEATPAPLYYSANGVFPNNGVELVPTKPLSECQHGWVLMFSGYDDTNRVPRDYYAQTVYIPKRSYKNANWNGESMTFSLVYQYVNETDNALVCSKTLSIFNNKIVSGSTNSIGKARNIVLRAIYEY